MAETRAYGGTQGRGIAVAVAAHVVIIVLLSVQWTAGQRRFDNPPMEVDLIAETAPQSTAPVISANPPPHGWARRMRPISPRRPNRFRRRRCPSPSSARRPPPHQSRWRSPFRPRPRNPRQRPKRRRRGRHPRPNRKTVVAPHRPSRRHRRRAEPFAAKGTGFQGRTGRRDGGRGQALDRRQHQGRRRPALERMPHQRRRCRSTQDRGQIPPDPVGGARRIYQR